MVTERRLPGQLLHKKGKNGLGAAAQGNVNLTCSGLTAPATGGAHQALGSGMSDREMVLVSF